MKHLTISVNIASVLGIGLVLTLLWLLSPSSAESPAAYAASLTVCPAGPPTCGYKTIQTAVDVAHDGDIIKVAAGTYTNVSARPAPLEYSGSSVVTQVVYINKTITVRGGYTTAFADPPDPVTNPTILDAQGRGRVMFIARNISPTIEGLRITGGNAAGLGGSPDPWGMGIFDGGGGIYIIIAQTTLINNQVYSNTAYNGGGIQDIYAGVTMNRNSVFSNTAHDGGGLCIYNGDSTLNGNTIISNTAIGYGGSYSYGGGLYYLFAGNATLTDNKISSNSADWGGGIHLHVSDANLGGNTVSSNTALNGGGMFLQASNATINDNTIVANNASQGGGLRLDGSSATLSSNIISSNSADWSGGLMLMSSNAMLTNNVIADNRSNLLSGSGLYASGSSPRLVHTTIARNSGGDGSGIYINGNNVILTNTILVSQTIGIAVNAGSTARLNGVLWFGNGSNTSGAGLISVTNEVTGNPTFKSDGYHLCPSSAAKDTGVNAGVTSDIDGEARPWGSGFDIGANEYAGVKPKPVAGLRVIKAITDTGAITATLIWQPPADVVTYTLYYASIPITDGNWNEATELVNGIAGSTTAYTASVPYGGGYVYFASKYWDTCGIASLLSGNAFWPHLDVYLPLMFKGNP